MCQPSGVWSGEEPICEGLEGGDCRLLTNPVGGSVALSGTAVGSRAEYSCNEGYNLSEGDKLRFCLETLHWSGEEAACEGMSLYDVIMAVLLWFIVHTHTYIIPVIYYAIV